MQHRLVFLAAGILLATASLTAAAGSGSWLHVRVHEPGESQVSVDLPMSLASLAFDTIEMGAVQLDADSIPVRKLKQRWSVLRHAGDGEIVTVEDGDDSIRLTRRGQHIIVDIDEEDGGHVRAQIPVHVIDAALSAPGNGIDIDAAIAALAYEGSGKLSVHEDGTHVQIWVDNQR